MDNTRTGTNEPFLERKLTRLHQTRHVKALPIRAPVLPEKIHFKSCLYVRAQPTGDFRVVGLNATSGVSQETLALATIAIFHLHTVCYALLRRIVVDWHTTCITPNCGHKSPFTNLLT